MFLYLLLLFIFASVSSVHATLFNEKNFKHRNFARIDFNRESFQNLRDYFKEVQLERRFIPRQDFSNDNLFLKKELIAKLFLIKKEFINKDLHYSANHHSQKAPSPVPEPQSLMLLGFGLLGIAAFSRKYLKRN